MNEFTSRADSSRDRSENMGEQTTYSLGKFLYAFLFVIVLPALLIIWTKYAVVPLIPTPHSTWAGTIAAMIGLVLMISGAVALRRHGGGLPMNPFPPRHYVAKGIYRYLVHPLYVGFCLACAGVAVAFGSASGFWLITPAMILCCMGLVFGYERIDLDNRFGKERARARLTLPLADDNLPSVADRVAVYLLVLIPWFLAYELAVKVTPFSRTTNFTLELENKLPVMEWTWLIYASIYVWAVAAPLIAKTRRQLREFAVSGAAATVIGCALFLLLPVVHLPRPFEPQSVWGQILLWEQKYDSAGTAFPAFHLVWTLLTARLSIRACPKLKLLWWIWAIAIAVSCLTTGMHSVADLLGAVALVFLIWNRRRLWDRIRLATESLANSWTAWRLGPIRIINHSIYAGLACAAGVVIASTVLPDAGGSPLVLVALCGVVGGALYAQLVEGSPRLLRPFGYFGAIIGCGIGVVLSVALFGGSGMALLAALAIAAPFVQAIGRLRCLVQGCCHGRRATPASGIVCRNPSSRVVQLAELANAPVYPTPLYSIAWNLIIGIVLIRLWSLNVPASLISGVYFILVGVGRFVEEAYRGEPQTPICAGLRSYQWWSLASVIVGAILTCVPTIAIATEGLGWQWHHLLAATIGGLAWGIATGVDFPESKARFARLTG